MSTESHDRSYLYFAIVLLVAAVAVVVILNGGGTGFYGDDFIMVDSEGNLVGNAHSSGHQFVTYDGRMVSARRAKQLMRQGVPVSVVADENLAGNAYRSYSTKNTYQTYSGRR